MPDFPVPAAMAHMVLRTADVPRLVTWYRTVLGCEVIYERPPPRRMVFLTFDAEHHRIGIAEVAEGAAAPEGSTGLAHVAYSYASFDDLLATYERLAAAGIEPDRCVNHRLSTSFYYADPDGNGVELFTDNPGTEAERKAAFALPTVSFDPARLLRRWHEGADARALAEPL